MPRACTHRSLVRRLAPAVAAIAAVGGVSACSSSAGVSGASGGASGAGGASTPLKMAIVGAPLTPGFNPFSLSDGAGTENVTSLVYEPLIMYNLTGNSIKPWLASKWAWSDGGRRLTFTIPDGRNWSDGKPLTARDVAFTFNLINRFPALNTFGITFKSASAPNAHTAILTFAKPAYTQLFSISRVLIVPQHIWSHVANPSKDTNSKPVGSGPYLLQSFTSQSIKFIKNPHYWQPGLPKVDKVELDAYTTQNATNTAISAGQSDWSVAFFQNVKQQWTGVNPDNKLWMPPAGDFFMCPNTADKTLANAAVRKAIAYSVDREKAIKEVEGPFILPSSSPTGLRQGQMQYMPSQFKGQQLSYDPAKVKALLTSAGYKRGAGGFFVGPNGQTLKLSLLLPSEYTDWMQLGQLFVNEMKAAGIEASLNGVSVNAWNSNVADGQYQVTFCGLWQTDSPYTTYNTLLNGKLTAPVGKAATSNVVRWNNATTNSLLARYATTNSKAAETRIIGQLATQVAEQMPIIPLMAVTSYGEYSTKRFTGWPNSSDPYQTNSRQMPWITDVLLHLKPVG